MVCNPRVGQDTYKCPLEMGTQTKAGHRPKIYFPQQKCGLSQCLSSKQVGKKGRPIIGFLILDHCHGLKAIFSSSTHLGGKCPLKTTFQKQFDLGYLVVYFAFMV